MDILHPDPHWGVGEIDAATELDDTLTHKKLSFSAAVADPPPPAAAAAPPQAGFQPGAAAAPARSIGPGVQVYLRLRPLSDAEMRSSERRVVDVVDSTTVRFDAPEVRACLLRQYGVELAD
jgi:hypothetical protein